MRQAAFNAVYAMAKRDTRVLFIGSDLSAGALDAMRTELPRQFFMEGIQEQQLVGMAAGLALDGYLPFVNAIATFLTRRCYEQVCNDVALHDLPVRLLANGGGVVYAPLGPTHISIEDISLMRGLPNMTIVVPVDGPEMARAVEASLEWPHPMYLRIARGGEPVVSSPDLPFEIGRAIEMRRGRTVALVGTGIMTARALDAAALLEAQGIDTAVVHVHTVKPLDAETICAFAGRAELVVTLEEHSVIGGLGSAVAEVFADATIATPLLRLGLPDRFLSSYGSQFTLLSETGLDPDAIAARVGERLRSGSRAFAQAR